MSKPWGIALQLVLIETPIALPSVVRGYFAPRFLRREPHGRRLHALLRCTINHAVEGVSE